MMEIEARTEAQVSEKKDAMQTQELEAQTEAQSTQKAEAQDLPEGGSDGEWFAG